MKTAFLFWTVWFFCAGQVFAAEPAHSQRRTVQDVEFHYALAPAAIVLAHPDQHPEREMHGGVPSKGASHLVLALFDAAKGQRIAEAEVMATVTLLGGASVTRRLESMRIADQPSFGGFFSLGAPGIYRIRFEVRRPGSPAAASAEFEHRVSAEGRRR